MATIPRVVAVSSVSPSCSTQETQQGAAGVTDDPRCNGTLRKQASPRVRTGEESSAQRYSTEPTLLLSERAARAEKDQDGYMTTKKEKKPTSTSPPPPPYIHLQTLTFCTNSYVNNPNPPTP